MKHIRVSRIFMRTICLLVLIVTLILTIPLNRILAPTLETLKAEGILISVIESVSLYKGRGFMQIEPMAPVWTVEYRLCAMLGWCVTLTRGANQLQAQASFLDRSLSSGFNLKDVEFVGNSDVLYGTTINSLSAFEIEVQADNMVFRDFNCPFRGLSVTESSVDLSQIRVLGEPFGNVQIDLLNESSESLTAIFKGAIQGSISVQPSSYQAELSMVDMPAALASTLAKNFPEFNNVDGWSFNGALPCTSSPRKSI